MLIAGCGDVGLTQGCQYQEVGTYGATYQVRNRPVSASLATHAP